MIARRNRRPYDPGKFYRGWTQGGIPEVKRVLEAAMKVRRLTEEYAFKQIGGGE